ALHGGVGAFARGAVGAVGDGHEARREHREPLDGPPERRFHFRRLRRKELERDLDAPGGWQLANDGIGHGRSPFSSVRPRRWPRPRARPPKATSVALAAAAAGGARGAGRPRRSSPRATPRAPAAAARAALPARSAARPARA